MVVGQVDQGSLTAGKKRKLPDDKSRYIELELAKDIADRRNVLDVTEEEDLFCKLCYRIIAPSNYSYYGQSVKAHLRTKEHRRKEAAKSGQFSKISDESGDGFITPPVSPEKKPCLRVIDPSQARDALCSLIRLDVPISQANKKANVIVVNHAQRSISPAYLRKCTVPQLEQEVIAKQRAFFSTKQHLYVSIDETSDRTTSYLSLIIGALEPQASPRRICICEVKEVDGDALCSTLLEQLKMLDIAPVKIKVLVTDSARAMDRCAGAFRRYSPDLIHIYCISHKLHTVGKFIKTIHPQVDYVIGTLKQLFKLSRKRANIFKLITGGKVPPMPTPHEIRWGTWSITANYLIHYIEAVRHFIVNLKQAAAGDKSTKLKMLQEYFASADSMAKLEAELASLTRYMDFPAFIYSSERLQLPLDESTKVIGQTRSYLEEAKTASTTSKELHCANAILDEFERNMATNKGLEEAKAKMATEQHLQYSPISSSETERSFADFRFGFLSKKKKYTGQMMEKMTRIKSAIRPPEPALTIDKASDTVVLAKPKQRKIQLFGSEYEPPPITLLKMEDFDKDKAAKKIVKGQLIREIKPKPDQEAKSDKPPARKAKPGAKKPRSTRATKAAKKN